MSKITKLLDLRIRESGLTQKDFAERVVMREARTVRRWRNGVSPIPKTVQGWLHRPEPSPWRQDSSG